MTHSLDEITSARRAPVAVLALLLLPGPSGCGAIGQQDGQETSDDRLDLSQDPIDAGKRLPDAIG